MLAVNYSTSEDVIFFYKSNILYKWKRPESIQFKWFNWKILLKLLMQYGFFWLTSLEWLDIHVEIVDWVKLYSLIFDVYSIIKCKIHITGKQNKFKKLFQSDILKKQEKCSVKYHCSKKRVSVHIHVHVLPRGVSWCIDALMDCPTPTLNCG